MKKKISLSQVMEIEKMANHPNTIIRVYPTKMTFKCKYGEVVVSKFKNDMNDYKDTNHKGVQGRSYVEWENGDFEDEAEVTLCEIMWLNNLIFSHPVTETEVRMEGIISSIAYTKAIIQGNEAEILKYTTIVV